MRTNANNNEREHEEEQLTRAYEDYRAQEITRLREALPPDELTAIEHSAIAEFEQTDTNQFGRERTLRLEQSRMRSPLMVGSLPLRNGKNSRRRIARKNEEPR